MRIDRQTASRAALALHVVTTAWDVVHDGFPSHDWRHLNGPSPLWTAIEGRWLPEVIVRDLLGENFLLPVQVALAFPCFWWVARTLAAHAAAEGTRPAAAFAISLNHIYRADTLSFESNVVRMADGCYTMALAPIAKRLKALTVRQVAPDGTEIWSERLALDALRPMLP